MDPRDVDVILFFDCTKLGVLTQSEINMAGDFTEKVLGKNPTSPGLGWSWQVASVSTHTK